MNRILAHVARLTRSILLQANEAGRRPSAQFIAGRHPPFFFPSGIGLSWWYSDDTFRAIETLASLIIDTDRQFKDCDFESVTETITSTLQQVFLDKPLFSVDDVFLGRKPNLFECRGSVSVTEFATILLGEIKANLRSIIGKRCTIYPLVRFRGPSFMVPGTELQAISRTDESAWYALVAKDYEFDGWSPQAPLLNGSSYVFPNKLEFHYALIAEEYGTQKGTQFASSIKFRTLIAVMFAIASSRSPYPYHKAMAQPFTSCIQFPHAYAPNHVITRSDCGALSPYYVSDIPLDNDSISELNAWYRSFNSCPTDLKQRLEKTTYFVNRGMNSEDVEAYINYFVALDALFGERGAVEASIIDGICSLKLDRKLEERTSWLFDLRNELVHGGSRYITEWPKYQRYIRHFETKPLDDIRVLSQAAILKAPTLFAA